MSLRNHFGSQDNFYYMPMFFRKTYIVSLLLLLVSAFNAEGQTLATMRGRVTDVDGMALHYAQVAAVSLQPVVGVNTDNHGRYSLQVPSDSLITISVRYSGYLTIDTTLRLRAGTTNIDFVLHSISRQLGTVTITHEKSRTTTFTAIDVERLERTVGPQGGVESLLKTLPDVSSNNEMSSQYSVRGGSFDENLVYINGVEVYRPLLIRNGQQEGLSIINPDLVDGIMFSPGGFDATYGDRMASVLDITYRVPYANADTSLPLFHSFSGSASASLLGATLSLRGGIGTKLTYSLGVRQHSNRYILRSLDTKGNYTTNYTDLQILLGYKVNDALDIRLLGVLTRNIYGLQPESQTTTFGGYKEVMQFNVYYEGEERDSYLTTLAAVTADYHPSEDMRLQFTASFQGISERENYDILSQFMLYELNVGNYDDNGETERFDRGIGSFLEHARNRLNTNVFSAEVRGTQYAMLGNWNWGLKFQHERVRDKMREWKLVDSAGYALPAVIPMPGTDTSSPQPPILQFFCRTDHSVATSRATAFLQRNIDLYTSRGDLFSIVAGVRAHWYDIGFVDEQTEGMKDNNRLFFSPRISLNYKPKSKADLLFRLAGGIYSQAPVYREYRHDDGSLNHDIRQQNSYQIMGTADWNFKVGSSPFKLTADAYYKYIDNLIPYRIDNLRVMYDAENNAVGYATGLSLRLSGEVVDGLESWASLSLMRTMQDIEGDDYGWLPRPADQRMSFKLFFQDYVPAVPFWRMSLGFIFGTGLPATYPGQTNFDYMFRYTPYFRVDWGNTIQLSNFDFVKNSKVMRYFDDILLTVEVFNLFNYRNVVSFTWVADYSGIYYPVPNYLTARQLNLKLTLEF